VKFHIYLLNINYSKIKKIINIIPHNDICMIQNYKRSYVLILILSSIYFPVIDCAYADNLNCYQMGFHLDSAISGGRYSISELSEIAVANNLDAIIFCDHDIIEIEYGAAPFRNLIKKKYVQPSINTFGFDKYFNLVDIINEKYDNLTIIAGAEINPRYYWENDPFSEIFPLSEFTLEKFNFRELTLRNWHQHMIVLGLQDPNDYMNAPVTANGIRPDLSYYKSLFETESFSSLFRTKLWIYLLALVGFVFSFFLFFHRGLNKVNVLGRGMSYQKKPKRKTAIIFALVCALVLINGYPYTPWQNSPYEDYERVDATQNLIDYVNDNNGLIFFAHPEGEYQAELGGIQFNTQPYASLLLKNQNYTGFGVFGEGWHATGNPGGIWDKVLMQYCHGEREKPVWAVGELDFEGELPDEFMQEVATFIWAKDNSKQSIISALRDGKCYATQFFGSKILSLDEWYIKDPATGKTAISGQTLESPDSVRIHFKISFLREYSQVSKDDRFTAFVIGSSSIIDSFSFSYDLEINTAKTISIGTGYYRLWIVQGEHNPIVASNPIFVNRVEGEEL